MSRATIEQFYAAFARLDGDAMQRLYAPGAHFESLGFESAGGEAGDEFAFSDLVFHQLQAHICQSGVKSIWIKITFNPVEIVLMIFV